MPAHHRGGLHQLGEVFPAFEQPRKSDPQDSERWREPRFWLLLAVQPIGAGRQLTTQCNDGCSRLGSWQREGAHEHHGIGSQLTDRSGGLDEVSADDPQGWHGHKREFLTLPAGALRTPRFRRGSTFRGDRGPAGRGRRGAFAGPLVVAVRKRCRSSGEPACPWAVGPSEEGWCCCGAKSHGLCLHGRG